MEIALSCYQSKEKFSSLPFGRGNPWLAPLAGFSDLPFRLLCRERGAAVACTEMVSAKGLVYSFRAKRADPFCKSSATELLIRTNALDVPLVVQLFGAEEEYLVKAVGLLLERGFGYFDLNMGCSVPKVTKTGAGAALLCKLPLALRLAKAMIKEAGAGAVGFKLRLGWKEGEMVYLDLARGLEDAGAAWLTLHPRFARQGFSGVADWGALRSLVQCVSVPVVASGDLLSASAAIRCLELSGASTLMFARGALRNPNIFQEYRTLLQQGQKSDLSAFALRRQQGQENDSPAFTLRRLILRHAELLRMHQPARNDSLASQRALARMRIFAPRYVRDCGQAKILRQALSFCQTWDAFHEILDGFLHDSVLH